MSRHICVLAFACAIVGVAGSATAQATLAPAASSDDDPGASARFRFGALRFTPALAITNVGVDNNVFNAPVDPRQDTTAAVGPLVNLWLRMGRGRLSGTVGGQYLYFRTYANQRAWNTADALRFEMPFWRLRPYVSGGYTSNRDRPGFEIDSRVRQKLQEWSAGSAVRLGPKTSLTLSGGQAYVRFDDSLEYFGVDVATSLNRRTDTEKLEFRSALTPLTTWVTNVEAIQDRFDSGTSRNANSVRVTTGFELKPAALINGTVLVGFRQMNVMAEGAPDYRGLVASVQAGFVAGRNKVTLTEQRDVAFSYDLSYPFFVQTSTSGQLTRRLGRSWDVVGRAALHNLSYTQLVSSETDGVTDRVVQYGGGLGYIVGRAVRIGVNVDYFNRTTESTASQPFEGLRAGLSFSYGLAQ